MELRDKTKINSFRDLVVWQRSADLAVMIYAMTKDLPKEEIYAISDQMRRAVISVSSNIAEGFKRFSKKEKHQFYAIAFGSLAELESQVEIGHRIGMIEDSRYHECINLINEVSMLMSRFMQSLSSKFEVRSSAPRSGFTLVELLVAITLFSIAISVAVGGFVRALRTQRELISLIAANSNVSLAIEQMAREMRTGKNFACPNIAKYCTEDDGGLTFENADGNKVTYFVSDGGVLERQVGSMDPEPFTAANIRIAYLHFSVPGTTPPRVTISLGIGVRNPELQENITNIQTTVSSRAF